MSPLPPLLCCAEQSLFCYKRAPSRVGRAAWSLTCTSLPFQMASYTLTLEKELDSATAPFPEKLSQLGEFLSPPSLPSSWTLLVTPCYPFLHLDPLLCLCTNRPEDEFLSPAPLGTLFLTSLLHHPLVTTVSNCRTQLSIQATLGVSK